MDNFPNQLLLMSYSHSNQLLLHICQDIYRDLPLEVCIHFLDESTNEEATWCVVMETSDALASLVKAVREPWEETFGVELEVNSIDSVV